MALGFQSSQFQVSEYLTGKVKCLHGIQVSQAVYIIVKNHGFDDWPRENTLFISLIHASPFLQFKIKVVILITYMNSQKQNRWFKKPNA